jgi:DNA-3-methyladenine glycosylase
VTPFEPLDRAELSGAAADVARNLLGTVVVRDDGAGLRVGRIVETEAYGGPEDRASHARAGRTSRTSIMFGPAGRAYVYLVYGLHHCLNVVCGADGEAAAVLVRAVQPIAGIERMRRARGAAGSDARVAAGPARLCEALGIDRSLDGLDLLTDDRLRLAAPGTGPARLEPGEQVVVGPRVGISYAGPEWATRPWRFGIASHAALSRPFPTAA